MTSPFNLLNTSKTICPLCLLGILTVALMLANLFFGSLSIPAAAVWDILCGQHIEAHPHWRTIIIESRLPQALTAICCGASLATAGLLLQTAFHNPLAGPSILGIDAGASLGVAIVMLVLGGTAGALGIGAKLLTVVAALAGAVAIMLLLLALSAWLRSAVMLLITGIVVSYMTGACISLLNFTASESGLQAFVLWGMGDFGGVTLWQLPLFAALCALGLLGSLFLAKPLDALLLGEHYAASLGTRVLLTRNLLLLFTGILTAASVAYCGPVSFLGLAVPHLARMALRTASHRTLLPATMLLGASLALLCNLCATLPPSGSVIPINVITPLIGAPVVLYVIMRKK